MKTNKYVICIDLDEFGFDNAVVMTAKPKTKTKLI